MVGKLVAEAIPYQTLKEKVHLTKQLYGKGEVGVSGNIVYIIYHTGKESLKHD